MKASLFLLFVFFAVALCGRHATREYQQQCGSLQCEKSGETCGYVDLKTSEVVTACVQADTEYCNVTQTGSGIQVGQCIAYATLGQSCQGRECGLGLECSGFLTPTCVAVTTTPVPRQPGQTCNGDSNVVCQFREGITNENTCTNGVCKYTADGSTCTGSTQCHYKSSCVSSGNGITFVCQARFSQGSACVANLSRSISASNGQCQEDLNCIPTSTTDGISGTCRAIYSQKEDGACKDDSDCKDGVCTPPDGAASSVYWGVCADYKKTSTLNKRCADDDDCTANNGEYCVCVDDDKSVCKNTYYDREYYKDIVKYDDCKEQADLKCAGLEVKDSLKCYLGECEKEFCKLYKNSKKEGGFPTQQVQEIVGSGDANAYCAVVQVCDASALFTSLPLLVAFAAIILLLQ